MSDRSPPQANGRGDDAASSAAGSAAGLAAGSGSGVTASAATAMLPPEAQAAQRALAARADAEVQSSLDRLIVLHGLDGQAKAELTERISQHFDLQLRVDEKKAAVLGGAVSGALGGLAADVGTAGMTLGGGMLAGAVLGALAAATAARGVNILRGRNESSLAWSAAAMDAMVETALLRYLAVAHFGRGRGEWRHSETPAHWRGVVQEALAPQRGAWATLWQRRAAGNDAAPVNLAPATLLPMLRQALGDVLLRLYPTAKGVLANGAATSMDAAIGSTSLSAASMAAATTLPAQARGAAVPTGAGHAAGATGMAGTAGTADTIGRSGAAGGA